MKRVAFTIKQTQSSQKYAYLNRLSGPITSMEKKSIREITSLIFRALALAMGAAVVGVLCMRAPQHIGGFFVDAAYHRRGIGRRLLEAMRRDYARQVFTVNSSPYAVEVYRHLGFVPTDTEQLTDGLRYTPMRYEQGGRS